MPEDGPIEEPGIDDEPELTPEQRERLNESFERLRSLLSPKINFNLPTYSLPTFDLPKFDVPTFKLPESTLRSISMASTLAAQQSKLLDAFKPAPALQDAWAGQLKFVDSDIFKTHAANQAQFAKLSAHLTKRGFRIQRDRPQDRPAVRRATGHLGPAMN